MKESVEHYTHKFRWKSLAVFLSIGSHLFLRNKNISLYFEKYEGELQTNVSPPEETVDAVADDGAGIEPEVDDETDVPAFELQEVIKLLDIDDIIQNLL